MAGVDAKESNVHAWCLFLFKRATHVDEVDGRRDAMGTRRRWKEEKKKRKRSVATKSDAACLLFGSGSIGGLGWVPFWIVLASVTNEVCSDGDMTFLNKIYAVYNQG